MLYSVFSFGNAKRCFLLCASHASDPNGINSETIWATDLGSFSFFIPLSQLAKQEQYSSNLSSYIAKLRRLVMSVTLYLSNRSPYFLIKIPLAPEIS